LCSSDSFPSAVPVSQHSFGRYDLGIFDSVDQAAAAVSRLENGHPVRTTAVAAEMDCPRDTVLDRLKEAARRGLVEEVRDMRPRVPFKWRSSAQTM
jgi:hypothetical protein